MRQITDARILTSTGLGGLKRGWNGSARIEVQYDREDEWEVLFDFYHDEISFFKGELIGLTEDDARLLFHDKDVRYLRS